ncbi:MAG: hypothetical protein K8R92_01150 [Planctomycetes bacterium]|nr:hypothetical protein [Planctomycetota bacterium]
MALPACKATPFRFDVVPMPVGTSSLIRAGFHGDKQSWACIDHAHDEYLAQWQAVVQREITGITGAIRQRSNALDPQMQGSWLKDIEFMEQLRRRHGALLTQLTLLDQNLFAQWGECIGPQHAVLIEDLAMDRAIARAKSIALPGYQSFIDLREVLADLDLPADKRAMFDDHMRTYARDLLPAANDFAAANVRRPIDGNDEAVNKAANRIVALNLRTIEMLGGLSDQEAVERFKIGFVNHESWKPTDWQKAAPMVIVRLPNLDQAQRVEIAKIVLAWEKDDRDIALRIANAMMRGKDDPRAKLAKDARQELLKQRNMAMIKAAGEPYRKLLEPLRKQSGEQLRSSIAGLLPSEVLGDIFALIPPPPPEAAPDGWPIRKSAETFALFLPPDFEPWVESRLRPLQPHSDTETAVSMTLLADSVDKWNQAFQERSKKIKDAEDRMKEASSSDISIPEAQRRLRTLVTEVDSARNALTEIEDQTIAELAAVLGLDPNDPRVERLRIERAVTASSIDWRKIPAGSLVAIDREATIDLPAAFAQAQLSPEANAITDAAIIDAAVPLVESSDRLRVATIDALRSFVLNMKKLITDFKFNDQDQAAGETRLREILAAAAKSVEPTARARVEVQEEILRGTCSSLATDDARELKRAYWRFAYPEIFYDRHPAEDMLNQMVAELPQDETRDQADVLLQTRQSALDELLNQIIEARKLWANDDFTISKDNFDQLQRRAPALAILLNVREEINVRALREVALMAGTNSDAWHKLTHWVKTPLFHSGE